MSIFDKNIKVKDLGTGKERLSSFLSLARWFFNQSDLRKKRAEETNPELQYDHERMVNEFNSWTEEDGRVVLFINDYAPDYIYEEDETGIGEYELGRSITDTYRVDLDPAQSDMWDRINESVKKRRFDALMAEYGSRLPDDHGSFTSFDDGDDKW